MMAGLLRGISILILGFLLGSAVTNMHMGAQIDYLSLANKTLRDELADAEYSLQKLKEATEARRKNTITSVEAFLLMDPREDLSDYECLAVEQEAEKKIKEWLNPLIGQEISGIDALLIPRIVDSREIEVNGSKYRLRTHLVVIGKRTSVYVKASRVKTGRTIN
ncbi:MAG: hypothetical protein ACOY4I_01615 [Bacillota bacterium]